MTTIFLVRHGLTEDTGRKLTGWTPGVALSDAGKNQVVALAERLTEVPFKAVYSSPIDRTRQTAEAIADLHGLDVQVSEELGEVDYGRWTGRPLKSLARTKLWSTVIRWPSGARFPDGEALREVQARAVEEVERLRLEHPKQAICCVSHGDVIKLVLAHYLGVHIDLFQRIHVAPASVSVLGVGGAGPYVLGINVFGFDGAAP